MINSPDGFSSPLAASTVIIACILLLCVPAEAGVVYETGFESGEGFSPGNLGGQDSWWAVTDAAIGPPVVQGAQYAPPVGAQAVELPHNPDDYLAAGTLVAKRVFTDPTATLPIVTIVQDVRFTQIGETGFRIGIYGASEVTSSVEFYAYGDIYVNDPGRVQSRGTWTADTWTSLEIVLDFTNQQIDAFYGGITLVEDLAFQNLDGFSEYRLWNIGLLNEGSSMFLDNLKITATPEPGAFATLAVGALAALWKRRRT
ncbi:MAG: PEP-CTERM sorting domain-containing protein [Phycisphaerae bacterium]|nr:PEP-CTERM sorting domain-containing protein [Phycisphaerae bacterium]